MALTNPPAAPDAPPATPSRSDEATFGPRADNAWSWLFTPFWTFIAGFRTWYAGTAKPELEALQADVASKQGIASAAATNAAAAQGLAEDARDLAQGYAATATNAANVNGTSASNVTIPASVTGSKAFVFVEADRAVAVGMYLLCADTAAPSANSITIQVTAWNAGTKTVTGDVVAFQGAGTKNAWTISLTGKPGATGADGAAGSVAMGRKTIVGTDTIAASDLGKIITCTGTTDYTVTVDAAATLGANYFNVISNAGTGTVTLANASIDGGTSRAIAPGEVLYLQGNGADVKTTSVEAAPAFGSLGAAAVIQATAGAQGMAVCRMSDTQAIAVWRTSSSDLRACTLNISGSTVTAGAVLVAVGGGVVDDPVAIARLSATVAVLSYSTGVASYALCLSVAGTALTAGAATAISSARNSSACNLVALSGTTMLFVGSEGKSRVLSIAGTTITSNPEVVTHAAANFARVALLDAGYFAILYAASNQVILVLVAYSGTTITAPTASTDYFYLPTGSQAGGTICSISGGRAFAYSGWTANIPGLVSIVERIAGTSNPANGPNVPVSFVHNANGVRATPTTSGKVTLVLDRQNDGGQFSVQAFDVRGSIPKPLCGKAVTRRQSAVTAWGDIAAMNETQAILFYFDPANSLYPTGRVLGLGTLSAF